MARTPRLSLCRRPRQKRLRWRRSRTLEMRLGWVTGTCLATANTSLASGSPISIVALNDKPAIVIGRVGARTASADTCPALLQDRRAPNESTWSFYELKLPVPIHLGIGVTGKATPVSGSLDLDGDGAPETFTKCASS